MTWCNAVCDIKTSATEHLLRSFEWRDMTENSSKNYYCSLYTGVSIGSCFVIKYNLEGTVT